MVQLGFCCFDSVSEPVGTEPKQLLVIGEKKLCEKKSRSDLTTILVIGKILCEKISRSQI